MPKKTKVRPASTCSPGRTNARLLWLGRTLVSVCPQPSYQHTRQDKTDSLMMSSVGQMEDFKGGTVASGRSAPARWLLSDADCGSVFPPPPRPPSGHKWQQLNPHLAARPALKRERPSWSEAAAFIHVNSGIVDGRAELWSRYLGFLRKVADFSSGPKWQKLDRCGRTAHVSSTFMPDYYY